MSKNQVETYLCFLYKSNIVKQICKLIVNKKGDIYITLPYINHDNAPTFIMSTHFNWTNIYSHEWGWLPYSDFELLDISEVTSSFKLTYHPSGFSQFSGTWNIISWVDSNGNWKWFSVYSNSFEDMFPWPFIGMGFQGDMNLFQKMQYENWKEYTLLPIYNKSQWKNIDMVVSENNFTVEFFLRKRGDLNILVDLEINNRDYFGILPHPNETVFKTRIFQIKHWNEQYYLWIRILIQEYEIKNNPYLASELTYSYMTASQFLWNNKWKTIRCFHGRYWENFFKNKINKNIELKNPQP